ncbi:hypothetical protein CR162_02210 [Pseudoroseomonas rhizosphaerae]|uniref:Histidine kinase/HSP90-like ATPase domain-containing protein n=1 Tax=Teichococcus rhizosphaerae TaxID=1335062 RepID=A0A2C7AIY9_9PROT|nr:ATP-binding protein [Pseudoroseomonas rhizosphaerae]PHK96737.1 hypothetical protein CR162_02210 [Pseudoroseomonas rhizosphaerae]
MAGSMELSLRLRPEAEAVPVLLDRLEAYAWEAGLPPAAAQRLALVCEEWLANVAMHGAGASFAELALWREADGLHLRLADDGPAFDPLAEPPPDTECPLGERMAGGLGLHLMRRMTRRLDYAREAGRNRLLAVLDVA